MTARSLSISQRQMTFLMIGVVLAVLLWDITTMMAPARKPQHQTDVPMTEARDYPGEADVKAMADWSLFGGSPVAIKPEAPTAVTHQATKLNLTLEGVVASEKGAYAMIRGAGDKTLFAEGDALGDQRVTVRQILPNKVIIDNRGMLEELPLDPDSPPLGEAAQPSRSERIRADQTHTLSLLERRRQQSAVSLPGRKRTPVALEGVTLSTARNDEGVIVGYAVSEQVSGALSRYGLAPDDVLVGVNGRQLGPGPRALQIKRALRDGAVVDLLVRRDGRVQTVSFHSEDTDNH